MISAIITAAVLIGATIGFILLFKLLHKKNQQKKQAKQHNLFNQLVQQHGLTITEKEEMNNYVIAIDKRNAKLVYLNFGASGQSLVIDLHKVKSVQIHSDTNDIYENRKGKSILVEQQVLLLQLIIGLKDLKGAERLTLYQYQDGVQDVKKIKKRAEDWQNKIKAFVPGINQN